MDISETPGTVLAAKILQITGVLLAIWFVP